MNKYLEIARYFITRSGTFRDGTRGLDSVAGTNRKKRSTFIRNLTRSLLVDAELTATTSFLYWVAYFPKWRSTRRAADWAVRRAPTRPKRTKKNESIIPTISWSTLACMSRRVT